MFSSMNFHKFTKPLEVRPGSLLHWKASPSQAPTPFCCPLTSSTAKDWIQQINNITSITSAFKCVYTFFCNFIRQVYFFLMNCLFRHILYHLISSGLRGLKLLGLYIFLIGLYELLAVFVRNIFPLLVVHLNFLFWREFSDGSVVRTL